MMSMSKLWLFLLTVLCGISALLLVVSEPELQRREIARQEQSLARSQQVAHLLLKSQAYTLLHAASQTAADAELSAALSAVSREQGELPLQHQASQAALRRLLVSQPVSFAWAVDHKGQVLSRIGQDEAEYRDAVDGLPVIEAALRGYRQDDLWLVHDTLYRVAAVPVVAPTHDHYIGAVLLGNAMGSEVMAELSQLAGVQSVFIGGGRFLSAASSPLLSAVEAQQVRADTLLGLRDAQGAQVPLRLGNRVFTFLDLPGQASAQRAVLVMAVPVVSPRILPQVLRDALSRGVPWSLLLLLAVGVGVLYGLGRLVFQGDVIQLLSSRNAPRSDDALDALEQPTFAGPEAEPEALSPQPAPAQREEPAPAVSEPAAADDLLVSSSSFQDAEEQTRVAGVSEQAQMAHAMQQPEQDLLRAGPSTASPLVRFATESSGLSSDGGMTPLPPPLPTAFRPENSLPGMTSELGTGLFPATDDEETRVAGQGGELGAASAPEIVYYGLFQEYVQARERCEQSVEGLSYALFLKRVTNTRESVLRDYHCHTVDFRVVIKDGKATLRATPGWDATR